jgi:hypothetical protein
MKIAFVSMLAVAAFIGLGMTVPQAATAGMSSAGLSAAATAPAPLVVEVKKWKNKNWNGKKWKNKNWNGKHVYRGPRGVYVRGWNRRPYYGTVIAGVALGTIIAATAAPYAPADNLCWYWTNPSKNRGYWDYCY